MHSPHQNGCTRHARQVQRPASPLLRGGECQAERRGLVQRVPFPDPTAFGKGGRPLEGVKWRVSFFWHVEHVVPASMCAHKFCMTERLAKNKAEGRLRGLRSISESMYVQLRVATPPFDDKVPPPLPPRPCEMDLFDAGRVQRRRETM